ncbi:MAG: PorV/PorQ family protein [Ignavibacteriales bacterium]|nr:PorV/PorQ family protein [Ignavibacteriales bacterium]MBI3786721.1 PorV/PorQ family protein [Ignavibacteriales bacterium]
MKTINFVRCALIMVLCVAQLGFAQQRKSGLTGAAFLKVGVGARAVGMGSAVTALPHDVNQMFWNPAGIALTDEKMQASFSYNKWIAKINHNTAAVSYNWEGVGTVGIGFISFGLTGIDADRDIPLDPSLKQFQIETNTSSTYDYSDVAIQLSYARYVIENLSLGASLKYISQTIDGQSVTAVAVDFGSVYHIGILDWTIAARFNNLGSDLKYYDIAFGLPLSFSIGTALSPYHQGDSKFTVAVDAVKPQDGPQYFYSGAEYMYMNMVAVRAGWKLNYSGTDDGGTSSRSAIKNTIEGLSAGAGVSTTLAGYALRLDYSYTQMDIVDAAHRITLSVGVR